MEESERLRREIRRLQGLIDSHRSAHGDAPRPPSWGNPRQPPFGRRGPFAGGYPPQPPRDFRQGRSWRKKYSLVNQPPPREAGNVGTSRVFGGGGAEGRAAPAPAAAPERHVDLTRDGNIVVGIQVTQRTELVLGPEGLGAEGLGAGGLGPEGFDPEGLGAEGLGAGGLGPGGLGPEGFDPEGLGAEGLGAEGFDPEGLGAEGLGPEGLGPEGLGAEGLGPEGFDPEGLGPEGLGPEGFGPEGLAGSYWEVPRLKTGGVAPGEGKNGQKSSAAPYPSRKGEPKPSLSVSFSSSHRVVSSSYPGPLDKPRTVRLSAEAAESSPAPCESAVAPKTEPQRSWPPPGCQQARHLVWCKPEPPAPGQSGCEQGGDVFREPKLLGGEEASSRPAAVLAAGAKSRFAALHKAPGLQRAAAAASGKASKFKKTNYTWVANPGRCCRAVKRWGSPRAPDGARKTPGGAERAAKASPKADLGSKARKWPLQPKPGVSPSKYKWKASALQASPSTSRSAFRWRCEDEKKPAVSAFPQASRPPSAAAAGLGGAKPFGDAVLSSYKVRSRTKIIRRKGSSGSPADKKSSPSPPTPLKSPFHAKKRNLRGKPALPKRCSPKGLLQLTKHRLCRLPAARSQVSTREGASLLFARSPPANKVIKTRYRIVKKNVVFPSSSFSSPVPSWKTRRLGTSRSPLLNQARPSPQGSKSQPVPQGWRSKGYRCIGGVMYRVSANKLSKTSSTPGRGRDLSTKSPGRAARLSGTPGSTGFSPSGILNRSATSRYIASRAVQRSLAIIRQAKQKKEKKKEYCMYYNRFGKCNRGENCPYIHDPEKVAVCTRFLRGTCKKTDGNCPFSHKVSKDKMPVCSYFLKGICSNSNCPYSHVYVSRKAEVCQDFLKGYCPMGEKCKKKHTLVCPDFAKKGVCPQGARCKLLHPQKKRQPRGDVSDPPSKCRRLCEETGRNDPAQPCDDGEVPGPSGAEQEVKFWREADASQSSRLQKLPSFISLLSASPGDEGCKVERDEDEPGDEPGGTKWKRTSSWAASRDSENAAQEEGGGRGKRLQIKPRL
ncbi:zinc finger CCCH domain-containing protein 3 isoform X9 [Cygnus atratus]|uniref:zinc finger CCCH domain-containing protein 3 isoform X9 n=1 Tax=Cygnus atratus TaxID=8868 RepID=UPI0021B841F8|nr:zinc finger CCCH domain-containing protein 3 isoform X9 [Cygnus atratus]